MERVELTASEEEMLARIRHGRASDVLWYEMGYLVPCFLVMLIAPWTSEPAVVPIAMAVYLVFHLRGLLAQRRGFATLKSLVTKLESAARPAGPPDDPGRTS